VPFNDTTQQAIAGTLPMTPAAIANSATPTPSPQSVPVISGVVNEFDAVQAAKASTNVAIRLTGFVEEGAAVVAISSAAIAGAALVGPIVLANAGLVGVPIAGAGSARILVQADRLAGMFGGEAADWAKMASRWSTRIPFGGPSVQVHWYANDTIGRIVEAKWKLQ
jgi:hypothetical protein